MTGKKGGYAEYGQKKTSIPVPLQDIAPTNFPGNMQKMTPDVYH